MNQPNPAAMSLHRPNASGETIGLVAGWGRFPVQVAETMRHNGYRVVCAALTGHADPSLELVCDDVRWIGIAKLGGHIRYFRKCGASRMTLAGKLFKHDLIYRSANWLKFMPDWTCVKTLLPHLVTGRKDARDDSLLMAIVNAYQQGGLEVCPATNFAPELLASSGVLTRRQPTAMERRDAVYGWQIAKQMGAMDIGQSVTVRDRTVLAVEAIEGTDRCIARTGEFCRRGGWTLVKVAKPQQDMRFDVPTIGPLTIDQVAKAGGTAIVIEAGKTIIVDHAEVLKSADRAGISILALDAASAQLPVAA